MFMWSLGALFMNHRRPEVLRQLEKQEGNLSGKAGFSKDMLSIGRKWLILRQVTAVLSSERCSHGQGY